MSLIPVLAYHPPIPVLISPTCTLINWTSIYLCPCLHPMPVLTWPLIAGNVFVIAAILLERNLQQVANFLIVSLAVADLMVACLVMPLGAVYEVGAGGEEGRKEEWVGEGRSYT